MFYTVYTYIHCLTLTASALHIGLNRLLVSFLASGASTLFLQNEVQYNNFLKYYKKITTGEYRGGRNMTEEGTKQRTDSKNLRVLGHKIKVQTVWTESLTSKRRLKVPRKQDDPPQRA